MMHRWIAAQKHQLDFPVRRLQLAAIRHGELKHPRIEIFDPRHVTHVEAHVAQ
jgi:hypothetical protein